MAVKVYRVPDVSCEHCVRAISQQLEKLDGVQRVDVNLDTKLVTVQHDDAVTDSELKEGIADAGYEVAA